MTDELIALLDGKKVGHLRKGARGRVIFVYSQAWREAQDAYPLSLSMPLAAQEHGPRHRRGLSMGPSSRR